MFGYYLILTLGEPGHTCCSLWYQSYPWFSCHNLKKRPEISQKCKCKTREQIPRSPCHSDMNSEVVQLSNIPVGSLKQKPWHFVQYFACYCPFSHAKSKIYFFNRRCSVELTPLEAFLPLLGFSFMPCETYYLCDPTFVIFVMIWAIGQFSVLADTKTGPVEWRQCQVSS